MTTLVAYSRRFFALTYTSLMLTTGTPIRVGMSAWAQCWVANRSSIVMLTAINTSITVGMEVVTRSVSAPLTSSSEDFHFLVEDAYGVTTINRQSLINIWMTFFASLLGGPVYFFKSRWSRFAFFAGFGAFNSVLGGCMSSIIRDGMIAILPLRVLFDFVYSGTFKFASFELLRSPILSRRSRPLRVGILRVTQDFFNTFFRVIVLNVLGFKG
ncbi:MAG: hypothetical protein NT027_06300 [Proteobacteria bacterium]|nr:hypothetical protein [Pseudomonadota bacterium]